LIFITLIFPPDVTIVKQNHLMTSGLSLKCSSWSSKRSETKLYIEVCVCVQK